jgi:hypothetical protein
MSIFDLRTAIESAIPAWALLVPVIAAIGCVAYGWWHE